MRAYDLYSPAFENLSPTNERRSLEHFSKSNKRWEGRVELKIFRFLITGGVRVPNKQSLKVDRDKLVIERKQQCLSVLNYVILDYVVRQIGIKSFSSGMRDEIKKNVDLLFLQMRVNLVGF